MEIQKFYLNLAKKEVLARDLLALFFERPKDFSFRAGQFVQFHIPLPKDTGLPFVLRSYSIASPPDDPSLEFCVKLLPNGKASNHFLHMEIGETIPIEGPRGRFTMNEEADEHIFIATGAGLAPVMSMLRDKTGKKTYHLSPIPYHLIFGVRSKEDLFWVDRLKKMAADYPPFSFDITLSQPDESWDGLRGRVTAHLTPPFSTSTAYYLCGSLEMVKDVRHMLTEGGVPNEKIRFEIF